MFESSPETSFSHISASSGLYHSKTLVSPTLPASLWATCRHVIYLMTGQVYSLLLDAHEVLVGAWSYSREEGTSQDIFLRFLFEKEFHLTQPYLQVDVSMGEPSVLLVPDKLAEEAYSSALFRIIKEEDPLGEEHLVQSVPEEQVTIMFPVPQKIIHVLDHYVRHYRLAHACGQWVKTLRLLADDNGDGLILTVMPSRVALLACREGNLQICNIFPAQTATEIMYYLQSVKEVVGWKTEGPDCYVLGEVTPDPDLPDSLWYHLPGLLTPPTELLLDRNLPTRAQSWRYGFLR